MPLAVDSVYFLMFPGWETELRSNRWHYATRWARHFPVVLIQPDLDLVTTTPPSHPDPGIPNCDVLHIQSVGDPSDMCATSAVQAAQVAAHMEARGHRRPLLWFYNPNLAGLYARLPAVGRVYHATENYFHFEGLDEWFIRQMCAALRMADVVVCVSEGVAASVRENVPLAPAPLVVSNGCDFRQYSQGRPDRHLRARARGYKRIAIYAGNINGRIDFDLIGDVATCDPTTYFAIYGPVGNLTPDERSAWGSLLQLSNVHHLGPLHPDAIRNVYAAADLGVVPYRQDAWLVENGFPLKVLEMGATGLPVVSTWMRPIERLGRGVVVTRTREAFKKAVAATSRRSVGDAVIAELVRVSASHDYDAKFETVAAALEQTLGQSAPRTMLDLLISESRSYWHEGERRLLHRIANTPLEVAAPAPTRHVRSERDNIVWLSLRRLIPTRERPRRPLRTRFFLLFADRTPERFRKALPAPLRLWVKALVGLAPRTRQ